MARKIFAGILVLLSAIFLVASMAGIGAIWYYNEPLTQEVTRQLKAVDKELAQVETTLKSSETELERALRIVDSAQEVLEKLTEQSEGQGNLLDHIRTTLDDRLIPELRQTHTRLETARTTLENLQSILAGFSNFIPGVDLNMPEAALTDLIASARSLDTEITNIEVLAAQASIFAGDTSFLLGGDLTQTRESLQNFLTDIRDYQEQVADWREQDKQLLEGAPKWIDQASIILTIFLAWFALSQFSLLVHGLTIQRGADPFVALRRERKYNPLIKNEKDMELEE